MDVPQVTSSPIEGYPSCFQFLVIMNNATGDYVGDYEKCFPKHMRVLGTHIFNQLGQNIGIQP